MGSLTRILTAVLSIGKALNSLALAVARIEAAQTEQEKVQAEQNKKLDEILENVRTPEPAETLGGFTVGPIEEQPTTEKQKGS